MLLCLSSGFTAQYRHDILRASALPPGAHLRFRYELELIPPGLMESFAANKLVGAQVCIAYLDRSNSATPPELVPCRKARLLNTERCGEFCVLDFSLEEFWFARDVAAFNREARAAAGNLPQWAAGALTGYFCQKFDSVPPSLVTSQQISDWQTLIRALKAHSDFANEPFFYYVRGVFPAGAGTPLSLVDGVARATAEAAYELRIVQFSPGETHQTLAVPDTRWIIVDAEATALSFITNRKVAIDSGYDEKRIRFRCASCTVHLESMISVYRVTTAETIPVPENAIWDFDLPVHVKPRFMSTLGKGLVIGLLISCQGLAVAYANPQLQDKLFLHIIILVAGLAGGVAASFGLRKP